MKILLIFPPSTVYGSDPNIPAMAPPIGLAYIGGYLEKHGYNVEIFDSRSLSKDRVIRYGDAALYGLTDAEIRRHVEKVSPDIVGISCMFTAYSGDVHRISKLVKEIDKNMIVVVGGAHASTFPKLVLRDYNVDIVVHAEGEETFLDMVRHVEGKKDYTEIKGISVRRNGAVVTNPPREFIKDLDTVPFPARHLLDMSLYLNETPNQYAMRAPSTTMITSRGCPQACIYCTIQSVWGVKRWRGRSPQNVVDEMEYLQKTYGIQELYWMDDSAGTSKKRLLAICDEIINRDLDIKWTTPNGIAHWYLDEHVLDRMKAAGCYRVTFGIESGNIETRKFLGKPYPLEQAKRLLDHANKIGMWTICTFIIGFPYEKEESIMDTISFACDSGTDMAIFYMLCPHPGTRVYSIFKEEGLLYFDHFLDPSRPLTNKDFEEMGLKLGGGGSKTKYFTPEELQNYIALAYNRFFKASLKRALNPLKTIRKIRSFEDLKYTYGIAKTGINLALDSIVRNAFQSQSFSKHRKKMLKLINES